jgi:tetratricopeptide (TPR) repeat protein
VAGGLLLLGAVAVAGCATISAREREMEVPPATLSGLLAGKPGPLHGLYTVLLRQGPRNAVLNQMRVGLAATELGAPEAAAEALDQALGGIETVYAQSETASKARQLWYRESYKDFKGEPYERAMAYYYRGLLYLREGDYENARASFKGGMLQDAFADDAQNRADFALLAFLEGWASHCLGDQALARQGFDEARTLKPAFTPPAADHNVLLIAETGTAPVKWGDGPRRSLLRYHRGDGFPEAAVSFRVGDAARPAFHIEDVFWQASTRGGRPVDYILEGKVAFKDNLSTAGNVMTTVGLATVVAGASNRSSEATIAGAAVTLLGLIAQGVSGAVKPEADVRYWETLPDGVHVLTAALPAPTPGVEAVFFDSAGAPVRGMTRPVRVQFARRCGIGWVRSRSAIPANPRAPGTEPGD